MDVKLNFVKDGVTKLPPGFRFQPTDEEIVFTYLARKIFCSSLPASVVPDINICNYDPWDLPGDENQDRYFFSMKEAKYRNGNRSNRATCSGFWKASGSDKEIVCSSKPVMGMKKTFMFYRGKPPHCSRTHWVMHEYRLLTQGNNPSSQSQSSLVQVGNWVLCHITMKKKARKGEDEMANESSSYCYSSSSSSCSDSSALTDVSSN